jgi:EpsI family protein
MYDPSPRPSYEWPRLSRRNVLIGGVLACASGVAFARQPKIANPMVDTATFESWLPKSFDGWRAVSSSGVVLPPPDSLRDRLYDNLATRVFVADGLPAVMLLLAYNNAQDGVLQVHRPEVCYPVGGFELSPIQEVEIAVPQLSVPANFFTATGPNRVEQVEYFTRLGSAFPRSWAEQRVAVMKSNLQGDIPDGMLMRVSAIGLDAGPAQSVLSDFAREFITSCDPKLRRLLLGRNT